MKTTTLLALVVTLVGGCGAAQFGDDSCAAARALLASCGVSVGDFECTPDDADEILALTCEQITAGQGDGKRDRFDYFGVVKIPAGQECRFNFQCDGNLICRPEGGYHGRYCRPRGTSERDRCDSAGDCESNQCVKGVCTRHCTPGYAVCENDAVYRCGADGASVTLEQTCDAGLDVCQGANGFCRCKPGRTACRVDAATQRAYVEVCSAEYALIVKESCGEAAHCEPVGTTHVCLPGAN